MDISNKGLNLSEFFFRNYHAAKSRFEHPLQFCLALDHFSSLREYFNEIFIFLHLEIYYFLILKKGEVMFLSEEKSEFLALTLDISERLSKLLPVLFPINSPVEFPFI